MTKTDITNTIAQNVKNYRLMNHLTQAQLAEKLYLDAQYYSQLERGERNFTIEKLILACEIFHVGIEKIVTIENSSTEDHTEIIQSIKKQLKKCSHQQLLIIDKFINEILPLLGS